MSRQWQRVAGCTVADDRFDFRIGEHVQRECRAGRTAYGQGNRTRERHSQGRRQHDRQPRPLGRDRLVRTKLQTERDCRIARRGNGSDGFARLRDQLENVHVRGIVEIPGVRGAGCHRTTERAQPSELVGRTDSNRVHRELDGVVAARRAVAGRRAVQRCDFGFTVEVIPHEVFERSVTGQQRQRVKAFGQFGEPSTKLVGGRAVIHVVWRERFAGGGVHQFDVVRTRCEWSSPSTRQGEQALVEFGLEHQRTAGDRLVVWQYGTVPCRGDDLRPHGVQHKRAVEHRVGTPL